MKPDLLERDYVIGGQALHDALAELRAEAPRTNPADAAEYILRTAAAPQPDGIYVTRPQLRAALENMPVWVRGAVPGDPDTGRRDTDLARIADPDHAVCELLGNLDQIEPGKPVDEPAGCDPVDYDAEVAAIAGLWDILSALGYEEQRRVLMWAAGRFCGAGLDA